MGKAPEVLAGRFELCALAGAGGMGTVYRARDLCTNGLVAVKVSRERREDDRVRFAREASLLATLDHPGIVKYVAHGVTAAGDPFLAMDWLEGEVLSARLARGALTVEETLQFGRGAAEAIAAVHRAGLVHRDVSPRNLFLLHGVPRDVVLLDFGLAKQSGEGDASGRSDGSPLGTPEYMSPEQVRAERTLDSRTDVFSLGCVLYECLAGRGPFQGKHVIAVMAKVLLDEAPRLRWHRAEVPAGLDALVAAMLSKDPAARPRDAASVVETLRAMGGGADSTAGPRAPQDALTISEQRVLCVVLAGAVDRSGRAADAETRRTHHDALRAVIDARAADGARVEFLANGAALVSLTGAAAATDAAARAVGCAIGLRAVLPDAALVVATGRGVLAGALPVGEVIDRAVRLLAGAPVGATWLDEQTAGLLDARFNVVPVDDGSVQDGAFALGGTRTDRVAARTLLGRPTACVGRDLDLAVLDATFAECVTSPAARAVLLTGPPGVGKSRICHEFLGRLESRNGVEILFAQGESLGDGSPFGMLARAIRRAAGVLEGEPIEVRRAKLRARLGRHLAPRALARVSEFLGELAGVPFPAGDSPPLRAARSSAAMMGDAMRAAWEDWLAAECAAGPVVLVLEDLHWGDLPTVRFVHAALQHLKNLPWMVIALARSDVHERFPDLWLGCGCREIPVDRLDRQACDQFAREALGPCADPALVDWVVDRAEGNAFYLEELIRVAAAQGGGDNLPDTVLGMVEARLDALSPEARRVLRAGSVFGQHFWRGGVVTLLGGEVRATAVDQTLGELERREVVARQPLASFPGEVEYAFRHALVRDSAYAMLTGDDRALGHRLAGAWLERQGEADAVLLARHHDQGGDALRAAACYRRAAEQALGGNDLAAAAERAEAGIARGATGEARGALRLVQAEACAWQGRHADAAMHCEDALKHLVPATGRWFRAVDELTVACGRLGRYDRVEAMVADVGREAAPEAARAAQLGSLCRAGLELVGAGRFPAVDAILARLERLGAGFNHDDLPLTAQLHLLHAARALHVGDPGACLDGIRAALAAQMQTGNARDACLTRSNLGWMFSILGDFERAESALRQALATAERLGLHHVAAATRHNLGLALAYLDQCDEALVIEEAAHRAFVKAGHVRLAGGSRIYLSQIALRAGDPKQAERHGHAAREILVSVPTARAEALAAVARSLVAQGRLPEALDVAGEARASLDALGGNGDFRSSVRLVWAETLVAVGDDEGARAAVRTARDALLVRAAKIRDHQWQTSFLHRVPDNARTLELARTWASGDSDLPGTDCLTDEAVRRGAPTHPDDRRVEHAIGAPCVGVPSGARAPMS